MSPFGAMITEAALVVGQDLINPFFQNPWRDDPREMDALTRHLGGEWPCVPFGAASADKELPAAWQVADRSRTWNAHPHGFGAHHDWQLEQRDAQTALARITYPETGPVAGLRRRVRLASESAIECRLDITPRADARIGVGLHPVFSLHDAAPGAALIECAGRQTAWTFPVDVEPRRSHLAADQQAVALSDLRGADGARVDARRVPFKGQSEDLILLSDPRGRVSLLRPDLGHRIDVTWNADDLPCCLLWLSNRGRDYGPWDGRVCAIGIEPIAAPFDLGEMFSASADTPLARAGLRSSIELAKDQVWSTEYAVSMRAL